MKTNFKKAFLILGFMGSAAAYAGTKWHILIENFDDQQVMISPNDYGAPNGGNAWGTAKCFNRPDALGGLNGKYVVLQPHYMDDKSKTTLRIDVSEITEGHGGFIVSDSMNCSTEFLGLQRYGSSRFDFFINDFPISLESFYSALTTSNDLTIEERTEVEKGVLGFQYAHRSINGKIFQYGSIGGDDDLPLVTLKYYGPDRPFEASVNNQDFLVPIGSTKPFAISSEYKGNGVWRLILPDNVNPASYNCKVGGWAADIQQPTCEVDGRNLLLTVPGYEHPERLRSHPVKLINKVNGSNEFNSEEIKLK